VLWVGGVTETEIKTRQMTAERAAQALRGAAAEGVVPGGGAALLACRPILQERQQHSANLEQRTAYTLLLRALEEPARTLFANAGYEASAVMSKLNRAEPGVGFDLKTGQVVDMVETGIFDIAATLKEAVHAAIAGAALALTIDTLVFHKNPPQSLEP